MITAVSLSCLRLALWESVFLKRFQWMNFEGLSLDRFPNCSPNVGILFLTNRTIFCILDSPKSGFLSILKNPRKGEKKWKREYFLFCRRLLNSHLKTPSCGRGWKMRLLIAENKQTRCWNKFSMTWRFGSDLFVIPNLFRDLVFWLMNLGLKAPPCAGVFISILSFPIVAEVFKRKKPRSRL